MIVTLISLITVGTCLCHVVHAADWPQWRGPGRNAISAESGLLQSWPAEGPKLAWHATGLGTGYSSVVIGQGRLLTMGRQDSNVIVSAWDAVTGKVIWTKKIGETSRHPSSTPTLDGDHLYALDPDGDLVCLTAATGDIVWQTNFIENFGGRMMSGRGFGESPLIDGDRLICTPGGEESAMVALNKLTGTVVWKAKVPELGVIGRDGAGFSSIVATDAAGHKQYVQLMGRGLIGINAEDGRFLWGYNELANNTANIPTPIVDREFVFAANGYSAGGVLLKLVADPASNGMANGVKAEVVYTLSASQFQNHHGGVVRLGDYIFAGHGNNNGLPTCLEFQTGRVLWKRRGPGVGSAAVITADGQLYFRYQNGVVALIEASPRGYQVNGTFEIPGAGGDSWAHPAIANGFLYLREQNDLWVYDIRKNGGTTELAASASPTPVPSADLEALRKQGILVESLSTDTKSPRPQATSAKDHRIYQYAMVPDANAPSTSVHLVTFPSALFSPQGFFQSDDVLESLGDLPGPMILNLAGTPISDAGLASLQKLNVVGLNLELCRHVTDAGLSHLRELKSLRAIILTGTGITHIGLRHLTANGQLQAIDLELCDGIADDACQVLGEMKQLKMLNMKKSGFEKLRITDVGLQRLEPLVELQVLNLYGNKVTDAGLLHLQPLKNLEELHLSLLAITDQGLKHLQPLTTLKHLELLYSEGFAGPTLTDGMVEFLKPLANLNTLNLTGAKLTDAGLERLATLKKLTTIQLVRTKVTSKGVKSFESALPNCKVIK